LLCWHQQMHNLQSSTPQIMSAGSMRVQSGKEVAQVFSTGIVTSMKLSLESLAMFPLSPTPRSFGSGKRSLCPPWHSEAMEDGRNSANLTVIQLNSTISLDMSATGLLEPSQTFFTSLMTSQRTSTSGTAHGLIHSLRDATSSSPLLAHMIRRLLQNLTR